MNVEDCTTDINFNIEDSFQHKILIVEDTKFINKVIANELSGLGYICDQTYDFEETFVKLNENDYDFIILDLNLPDAYGEELVSEVLSLSKTKIIVLTSETDIQLRETLFKYGILDYIVKDNEFSKSLNIVDDIIKTVTNNDGTNILVIDDSKFVCKQFEKIFKVRNYNVLTALNASDGLITLATNDISLIILDMELPDKHGLEVLKEIKQDSKYKNLPIIIISGYSDPEIVRNTLKAGAADFIQKPFNIEVLVLKAEYAIALERKDKKISCEHKILEEYKTAVDDSTIVSKTDAQGRITFVNDKFCAISGYTREELIGKPHSIVRDPDTPSEVFKEMWQTIKNKKPWHGEIKNRAKNGKAYFVESTINPIVDNHGNIIEYIGIRTDITELENIKRSLEKDLNISNENFHDAYQISQEYQNAIDSSSIVSRVALDKTITYVNDEFCKISGYTKEELIGKTHFLLRDPKNPANIYKELWKTIESGKIWKGQLRNIAKDGSTYFVKNTVVPIINKDKKIVEYVSIMHNVTDIVMIHQELEDTQKEIIYKMGEVGETRSKETGNHVKRVAEYSRLLAILSGLGKKNAELLYAASPMHDIGKVGIPDEVLLKPGKLTDDEWIVMRTHSELGYNILKDSKRPILRAAAVVAYRHHEKWDGSGYPNGLSAEKIHIFGRITALADVFDALGSDRTYKKAWALDDILALLKEQSGKHFDPKLVELFLENLDKFLEIRDNFVDL